jgi:hypothetical protein
LERHEYAPHYTYRFDGSVTGIEQGYVVHVDLHPPERTYTFWVPSIEYVGTAAHSDDNGPISSSEGEGGIWFVQQAPVRSLPDSGSVLTGSLTETSGYFSTTLSWTFTASGIGSGPLSCPRATPTRWLAGDGRAWC